jgi:hypothetical protein
MYPYSWSRSATEVSQVLARHEVATILLFAFSARCSPERDYFGYLWRIMIFFRVPESLAGK